MSDLLTVLRYADRLQIEQEVPRLNNRLARTFMVLVFSAILGLLCQRLADQDERSCGVYFTAIV
ncbi:hypothetical protein [Sphingobium fuliginis]|uniref:hypothetical protein n=1 Tax=Sphingobium fuliginis (strain ATCC 27551) TaxID=336203 RepID=UPI00102292CF|nr:hypothetical protein [Sphingobium fuliginis]RYM01136.1 hypothetical protein EWH10_03585 [Sphingobium fuliginis]